MGQPNLIIPSRYLRAKLGRTGWGRPRQIVGIDMNHPCAGAMQAAMACIGGTTVIDYATGQIGAVTGSPVAGNRSWIGASLNGNAGKNYVTFAGRPAVASQAATLAGIITQTGSNATYPGANTTGSSTGLSLNVNLNANFFLVLNGSNISGPTLQLANPYFIFASINTLTGVVYFVARNLANGRLFTQTVTGQTTSIVASNGVYAFNTGENPTGITQSGSTAAFFYTEQANSLAAGIAWALDPWGIFLQPRPARWVGKSAAAFLPAWALQRNTVNGGVAT